MNTKKHKRDKMTKGKKMRKYIFPGIVERYYSKDSKGIIINDKGMATTIGGSYGVRRLIDHRVFNREKRMGLIEGIAKEAKEKGIDVFFTELRKGERGITLIEISKSMYPIFEDKRITAEIDELIKKLEEEIMKG